MMGLGRFSEGGMIMKASRRKGMVAGLQKMGEKREGGSGQWRLKKMKH